MSVYGKAYKKANAEKIRAYREDNAEKIRAREKAYRDNNPNMCVLHGFSRKVKAKIFVIKEIVPQELIEIKVLQLISARLIKEKGLNNEPTRI